MRQPLHFITREKEWELIQRLLTIVDSTNFHPKDTAVIMASPDYSATVAMHLAHAWSREGEMLPVIPVDVTYPDEEKWPYIDKFRYEWESHKNKYKKLVLVEAGIIRGGNWAWLVDELQEQGYRREDLTLVALCENVHTKVRSDYVGEYYDAHQKELMFYFERFNKHWEVNHGDY